ncbi:uncharacterized protein EAE97_007636 [Botrytis byssoidea]|uniref:DUF7791 domain-containing protein n=1 Tax=Botrytis byssoidea TaxID=139641 RepID=A0A9P5IJF4_9HELO|nr:uncharacterized protein EAE97_007636 [Botrytis byssoidea]KAF7937840.1 hypothetical protein EAE97_007636 [Botrytis byssoidea]
MVALTDLFQSLAALPRVKFVLSSRPLPAYVQAFQAGAGLELRMLTKLDIEKFVSDKLKDRLSQAYGEREIDRIQELIECILKCADGVFRWVDHVVEAVLEGIRDYNTLYELQKQVEKPPVDLIPFYGHMWNGIKPEYRIEASKLFQIVWKAMMDEDAEQPEWAYEHRHRAVTLFFATTKDPDQQVFACPILPLTTILKAELAKFMEGRLRSRCMGLLDFHCAEARYRGEPDEFKLAYAKVQLANRSVSEFLDIRADILAYTEGTGFDTRISLMRSFVRQIEAWEPEKSYDFEYNKSTGRQTIWFLVGNTMRLVSQAGTSLSKLEVTLLDHMNSLVQARCQTYINHSWNLNTGQYGLNKKYCHWSDFVAEEYNRPVPWHDSFLNLAVRHRAIGYVQQSLMKAGLSRMPGPTGGSLDNGMHRLAAFRTNNDQLSKPGRPILDYAVRPEPRYQRWIEAINPDQVELLVDYGANPNEVFNGWTP